MALKQNESNQVLKTLDQRMTLMETDIKNIKEQLWIDQSTQGASARVETRSGAENVGQSRLERLEAAMRSQEEGIKDVSSQLEQVTQIVNKNEETVDDVKNRVKKLTNVYCYGQTKMKQELEMFKASVKESSSDTEKAIEENTEVVSEVVSDLKDIAISKSDLEDGLKDLPDIKSRY